ncbi:MAG: hypothetical protein IPP71_14380 [Bacteroidetes bacterium]|nr:hypothetical protein [Bacteroidota bacterium]
MNKHNYPLLKRSPHLTRLFLLLAILLIGAASSFAQTVATTLANNNGSSIVIGTLENANASPIIINSINCAPGTTGTQTFQLWTKPVAGNNLGAPGAVSVLNGWTLQASNTLATTAQTTQTGSATQEVMSGLNVSLAPGFYRFCIAASSIRYSTIGVQACTFTNGGVTINYCALNGYGGTLASPLNTPRGLVGAITFSPSTPCLGIPNPGNTLSTQAAPCNASAFTLSLQNLTSGTGVSYQWQADAGAGYANIGGATSSSLTTTQSVATSYQCEVTCSGGGTTISNPISLGMTTGIACLVYCASSATSTADEDIGNVTVGGINNTSACLVAAPGPGSVASMYSNFRTSVAPGNITQGATEPFSVSVLQCNAGPYSNQFKIYIDYNQNGSFTDPGEEVAAVSGAGAWTGSGSFIVPIGATLGTTVMRVVDVEGTVPGPWYLHMG